MNITKATKQQTGAKPFAGMGNKPSRKLARFNLPEQTEPYDLNASQRTSTFGVTGIRSEFETFLKFKR